MWRFYSILSLISGIFFVLRIFSKRSWFDSAEILWDGYYQEEKNKNKITRIRYGIKFETGCAQIIFKREGLAERVLKSLWICKEFQVGDPVFDREVFIVSDDPVVGDILRSSVELQKRILELLSATDFRINNITISRECVWVEMPGSYAGSIHESLVLKIREALRQIHEGFRTGATPLSSENYKKYLGFQIFNNALILGSIVFLLLVGNFDSISLVCYDHIKSLTIYSTLGYVLLYPLLIVIALRRTSYAMLLLRDFMILGILSVALFFSQLFYSLNIAFDKSHPKFQKVEVLNKFFRGRRSRSYYITVTDWQKASHTRPLKINSILYRTLPGAGPLFIKIHQGFLKDPWIEYGGSQSELS